MHLAPATSKDPRERLEALKRAIGDYEIRDYKDAVIGELIAILDLILSKTRVDDAPSDLPRATNPANRNQNEPT